MPKQFSYSNSAAASGPDGALLIRQIYEAHGAVKECTTRDDLILIEMESDVDSAAMDATVAAHDPEGLDAAKTKKAALIDKRTDELIAAGMTHAGKKFSLSLASQMKMVGSHEARDEPAFSYPVSWNTLDDKDKHNIADSAELHTFYLTAMGTIRAHLDSGTAIKDQVRAATTVAAVEAVEDPR